MWNMETPWVPCESCSALEATPWSWPFFSCCFEEVSHIRLTSRLFQLPVWTRKNTCRIYTVLCSLTVHIIPPKMDWRFGNGSLSFHHSSTILGPFSIQGEKNGVKVRSFPPAFPSTSPPQSELCRALCRAAAGGPLSHRLCCFVLLTFVFWFSLRWCILVASGQGRVNEHPGFKSDHFKALSRVCPKSGRLRADSGSCLWPSWILTCYSFGVLHVAQAHLLSDPCFCHSVHRIQNELTPLSLGMAFVMSLGGHWLP